MFKITAKKKKVNPMKTAVSGNTASCMLFQVINSIVYANQSPKLVIFPAVKHVYSQDGVVGLPYTLDILTWPPLYISAMLPDRFHEFLSQHRGLSWNTRTPPQCISTPLHGCSCCELAPSHYHSHVCDMFRITPWKRLAVVNVTVILQWALDTITV